MKWRLAAGVVAVAGMVTACGSSRPHLVGSYGAQTIGGVSRVRPGESVDLFVQVGGPSGTTVVKVSAVIPIPGYRAPHLVHAAVVTGVYQGGDQTGWPITSTTMLAGQSAAPSVDLAYGVVGSTRGFYAVAGVNVEVRYRGHLYNVRGISPGLFGVDETVPQSLINRVEKAAPTK